MKKTTFQGAIHTENDEGNDAENARLHEGEHNSENSDEDGSEFEFRIDMIGRYYSSNGCDDCEEDELLNEYLDDFVDYFGYDITAEIIEEIEDDSRFGQSE